MESKTSKSKAKKTHASEAKDKPDCGIIMPISEIDGCSEAHWKEVLEFLKNAITEAGFKPNLVSNAEDVKVIHGTIVENIGTNAMVVCDVSGKNPNVMLELGMRLAFNLPVVIIKDYQTKYEFDISPIEHIEYPRDLRFNKTNKFREKLIRKISATYSSVTTDPNYKSFLDNFQNVKPGNLEDVVLPPFEYLTQSIEDLKKEVTALVNAQNRGVVKMKRTKPPNFMRSVKNLMQEFVETKGYKSITDVIDRGDKDLMHNYVVKHSGNVTMGVSTATIVRQAEDILNDIYAGRDSFGEDPKQEQLDW